MFQIDARQHMRLMIDADFAWYCKFVLKRAPAARPSTRAHLLSLDFRSLARVSYHYRGDRTITSTFAAVPSLFPNLRCILLDGDAETDARALQSTPWHLLEDGPAVLSLSGCQFLLGSRLFGTESLRALTCLDVSGLPGSIRPLISAAHDLLPRLRVLKARRREIGAADAADLAKAFAGMLWSLDVSDNPVTDAVLPHLVESLMPSRSLRDGAHFEVEGILEWSGRGTSLVGPFCHVTESGSSASFGHPARYLADSPLYYDAGLGSGRPVRMNGRAAVKDDSLGFAKAALTADPEVSPAAAEAILMANAGAVPMSLTHLRLSNTRVTALGMEALIRMSPGQLELVDCVSMRIPIDMPWPTPRLKQAKLYGMPGSSHIWRPVFSSNIRSLRIHHSVVTQIPTLEAEALSPLTRLWLAETAIRARCEMAYPQAFVPDTNPRVLSLTLTKVPRRSSGPLIDKITSLLRLASVQERHIADATISSSRRAPMMLRGLRHIALEFEPDPMEDLSQLTLSESLNMDGLLDADRDLFDGKSENNPSTRSNVTNHVIPSTSYNSRLEDAEGLVIEGDFVVQTEKWQGNVFRVRVWVGSGIPGPHPAVNAYMSLVRHASLRKVVGTASPTHVKAGVPPGSYLFLDAWDAILIPNRVAEPQRGQLEGMKDVIAELKKYRMATREAYAKEKKRLGGEARLGAPHYFYTGRVEVVAANNASSASEYWR